MVYRPVGSHSTRRREWYFTQDDNRLPDVCPPLGSPEHNLLRSEKEPDIYEPLRCLEYVPGK